MYLSIRSNTRFIANKIILISIQKWQKKHCLFILTQVNRSCELLIKICSLIATPNIISNAFWERKKYINIFTSKYENIIANNYYLHNLSQIKMSLTHYKNRPSYSIILLKVKIEWMAEILLFTSKNLKCHNCLSSAFFQLHQIWTATCNCIGSILVTSWKSVRL